MTTSFDLTALGIDADEIRSGVAPMQDALTRVVAAQPATWTAPWPQLVSALYDVGRFDQCLGRLVEGHADALRILDQAHHTPRPGVYGVWASRSAGTGLRATPAEGGWVLSGELRFTSGIDLIDRALIPGWVDDYQHLLFDLSIRDFTPDRDSWRTSAMDASRSFNCTVDELSAGAPIGPENFYLDRPGFAIGGIGPAAVWAGGAQLLVDLASTGLKTMGADVHQSRRLGAADLAAWSARSLLDHVAADVCAAEPSAAAAQVVRLRSAVVEACDTVIAETALIVGPGGMSRNGRLIRAHQDLALFVRQHHLDRTYTAIGTAALDRLDS